MSPAVPSRQRPEGEHRWAVAVVADLDVDTARTLAATASMPARLDGLCELLLPADRLPRVTAVRGPMCSECRVTWEDVHADTTRPWPCPGKRPKALGGPLVPNQRRKSRQERRAEQRKANATAGRKRDEGDAIVGAVQSAIWRDQHDRQLAAAAAKDSSEAMTKLGEALEGADDLEGYLV